MSNIEPTKICFELSKIFVNLENELKENPSITTQEFAQKQSLHPNEILYSVGFQSILIYASFVPLYEILKKCPDNEFEDIKHARNAICHNTYSYEEDSIIFIDTNPRTQDCVTINMTPEEVVSKSLELIHRYNNDL